MSVPTEQGRPRLVFCRVGWMQFYDLWPEDEGPIGGGAFNEDDAGGETYNFREFDGRYLGYVQVGSGLNLRRIDPSVGRRAEHLDDVLVALVAKRPHEVGQVVVGWYAGARCHASIAYRRNHAYVWAADPDRAVLLPKAERTISIPKGKGGMGQANVAYAFGASGDRHDGRWIDEALERIAAYSGPNLIRGAAYDELDEVTGHREQKEFEMLDYVIERGVKRLWRGAEVELTAPGEPHAVIARRDGRDERIIIRATEEADADIVLEAEHADTILASTVPYALLAVTGIAVRVRNGAFVFSGGSIHREVPFRPARESLVPVAFRYSWARQ